MSELRDILLIGLGHRDRGDDGVGPTVADEVASRGLSGVDVANGPRDAAWILDAWRGRQGVVIVDCIRSDRPVGTVHRIDPLHGPFVDSASASTHGLGLASAVELGRVLGDLPRRVALVGIEGGAFELGASMSPEVHAAVPSAASLIEEIVAEWRAESAGEVSHA